MDDRDYAFGNFMNKQQLIYRAQSLASDRAYDADGWRRIRDEARSLMDEWKSTPGNIACEEAFQSYLNPFEDMWDEFKGYLDETYQSVRQFFEERSTEFDLNAQEKSQIIRDAQALLTATSSREAWESYLSLKEAFIAVGSAGEHNQSLWDDFFAVGSEIKARRENDAMTYKARLADAAALKRAIIKEAAELESSTQWKFATQRFRDLFDAWKSAGSAGRDIENALWTQFKGHKDRFHERRIAYFAARPPTDGGEARA